MKAKTLKPVRSAHVVGEPRQVAEEKYGTFTGLRLPELQHEGDPDNPGGYPVTRVNSEFALWHGWKDGDVVYVAGLGETLVRVDKSLI